MLLQLRFDSDVPIYQQIRDQIVVGIADGHLQPGQALASETGVNMMTVSKAYQLLKQEGYLQTDRRNGTVISGRRPPGQPEESTLRALRVSLSELRLAGLSKDDVIRLVERLYTEGGD